MACRFFLCRRRTDSRQGQPHSGRVESNASPRRLERRLGARPAEKPLKPRPARAIGRRVLARSESLLVDIQRRRIGRVGADRPPGLRVFQREFSLIISQRIAAGRIPSRDVLDTRHELQGVGGRAAGSGESARSKNTETPGDRSGGSTTPIAVLAFGVARIPPPTPRRNGCVPVNIS